MRKKRHIILQLFVIFGFIILAFRLFHIQIVDSSYKHAAYDNFLRYEVQFPPRGEIYDRNGEFLARSIASYDLVVVPRSMSKDGFDTVTLSKITGASIEHIKKGIKNARAYSNSRPSVVIKQITTESKLLFDEGNYEGFYTVFRTMRSYPRKIAGNLLGYIGLVDDKVLDNNPYYKSGDYIGYSGIEAAYEDVLRGEKGVKVSIVNVRGVVEGSHQGGMYDTPIVPGIPIFSTIDAELQEFGEELMRGKVGSIVAIEPSTGEILISISSPSYDPDELSGRDRGNNYMKLLDNKQQPLFNRSVMTSYPPGSTFKLVNALIGLQEGVLKPNQRYACRLGYYLGRGKMLKCHKHRTPLDLRDAVSNSCNAYFCHVFRNILSNPEHGGVDRDGYAVWEEYVRSFGFGNSLNTDFASEKRGYVPNQAFYDKYYSLWNSLTVISLSIGQGELGCSPLQMANLAAIIANRGYYYPPHVVKEIKGRDSLDSRFYERHYSKVDEKHFEPIIDGMYGTVQTKGLGTAYWYAYVKGLDICGKTGTAENPHGEDHSTFLAFAPKDNPQIAISVYVENGGFGSTVAAPIASLIIEKYLTGKIARRNQGRIEHVKEKIIEYPNYDQ